jgi:hypothetical protein
MPEFGISSAERPTKSVKRDSGLDMTIICDINVIIDIGEIKLIHLPEHSKCNNCQNDIYA